MAKYLQREEIAKRTHKIAYYILYIFAIYKFCQKEYTDVYIQQICVMQSFTVWQ